MSTESHNPNSCRTYGWLDSLAISMSLICAVHCLLTPVLTVVLPIVATTFWANENFHLWMVLCVVPTTTAAVYMGCRKHKDKIVPALSMIGLIILVSIAAYETVLHASAGTASAAACAGCDAHGHGTTLSTSTVLNVLGGCLIAAAHIRNYLLCRKSVCDHDH